MIPGSEIIHHPSIRRWLAGMMLVVPWMASVALCLEYGFDHPVAPIALLHMIQWWAVCAYVLGTVLGVSGVNVDRSFLSRNWHDIVAATTVAILFWRRHDAADILRSVGSGYTAAVGTLAWLRSQVSSERERWTRSGERVRPGQLLVTSFGVVIVLGAVLLALPKATSVDRRENVHEAPFSHVLNSLFTATSATCVTGLVVYDTGEHFSRFGQVVILILIQLGGLGIMMFGSLFGLLTGRQLSLRESLVLQDAGSHHTIGAMSSMVRFIVGATILIELLGAVVLYDLWPTSVTDRGDRIFLSVFHAVSAFCNAGFALQSDSLVSFRGAWRVYGCIMPLIVIGGLGFPVLWDLQGSFRDRLRRWWPTRRGDGTVRRSRRGRRYHLSLHTKIVLVTTVILIVLPTIAIYVFESVSPGGGSEAGAASMGRMSPTARAWASLFQAVTTRTAGFNTADLSTDAVSPATTFLMCLLMFIGGSPASTAGGVKTAAAATLVLAVLSTLRRRQRVECFNRTIPDLAVQRSAVLVMVMFAAVALVTLGLCLTESSTLGEVLFESVSACGTVGLSQGLTPHLTWGGRVIIITAMFAGRLGPLTLLVVLAGRGGGGRYDYPEEQIVIG